MVHDGLVEDGIETRVVAQIAAVKCGILLRDDGGELLAQRRAGSIGKLADMLCAMGVDEFAGIEDFPDIVRMDGYDQRATLGVELQEALDFQAQERLAHGGARQSDGGGDVALGKQSVLGVVAADDAVLYKLIGALGSGW